MAQLQLGRCEYCDRPLIQSAKGRNKKFCGEECRQAMKREEKEVASGSME